MDNDYFCKILHSLYNKVHFQIFDLIFQFDLSHALYKRCYFDLRHDVYFNETLVLSLPFLESKKKNYNYKIYNTNIKI